MKCFETFESQTASNAIVLLHLQCLPRRTNYTILAEVIFFYEKEADDFLFPMLFNA